MTRILIFLQPGTVTQEKNNPLNPRHPRLKNWQDLRKLRSIPITIQEMHNLSRAKYKFSALFFDRWRIFYYFAPPKGIRPVRLFPFRGILTKIRW